MVLINGVKYACERCIRGHRVTTCTHTDQPLTMIKPKGRPASQCQHCREQRKLKHSHVSCSCGKKGKSPGQHLASCLCHKNSHCTCSSNGPKKATEKLKKKSLSKVNLTNLDSSNVSSNNGSETSINFSNGTATANGNGIDSNYIIEDVLVPFDSGYGLFDLFPSKTSNKKIDVDSNGKIDTPSSHENENHDKENGNLNSINDNNNMIMLNDPRYSNTSDSEDLDMVENMFPLFPLVGSCSFDDSKSLPMTQIPQTSPKTQQATQQTFTKASQNPALDLSEKRKSSSASLTNQSRPFVPISSASSISSHHQPMRPKRPESALSIASNSSNISSNIHENNSSLNFGNNFNFPTQTSSAYPPIDFSEELSDDQNSQLQKLSSQRTVLQQNLQSEMGSNAPSQISATNNTQTDTNTNDRNSFFDSNDVLSDPYDLRLVSYEDFLNNLNKSAEGHLESPASTTPQSSSIPSRQPLQNKYKRSQENYQIQPVHHQQHKPVPHQPMHSNFDQQLEQQLFQDQQPQQTHQQIPSDTQVSPALAQQPQQFSDFQDVPQYNSAFPDAQFADYVPPLLSEFISPSNTDNRGN